MISIKIILQSFLQIYKPISTNLQKLLKYTLQIIYDTQTKHHLLKAIRHNLSKETFFSLPLKYTGFQIFKTFPLVFLRYI